MTYDDRPFKQLALGSNHVLALRHDARVIAWGENQYGQCDVPTDLGPVTQIAAGSGHSLALQADGTLVAWGDNRGGECDIPADVRDVVLIAAGVRQSFVAMRDGRAYVWGYNEYGPLFVTLNLPDVVQVSLGVNQSRAVLANGHTVAWGNNRGVVRKPPVELDDVIAVSVGLNHELALTRAGRVITWGNNKYRQATVPPDLPPVQQIFAGNDYSLALCHDGTIAVWGNRERIQYAMIRSLRRITQLIPGVASTTAHALCVRQDGQLFGVGNWLEVHDVPQRSDLCQVAIYRDHALARTQTGAVVAWGDNRHQQATVPADVHDVVQVAVGEIHSVALLATGTVVVWGGNFDGQYAIPTDLDDVCQIAAASAHTLALRRNGTVVAWGHNTWGQCTVPDDIGDVVSIAAGFAHTLALRRDGTVVAWGANFQQQCVVPAGLSDVIQIAASGHSLALRRDGTVVAWGRNDVGQCDIPADLDDVIAVATGRFHSLLLRRTGHVVAIGKNNVGQCDVPVWLNDVVHIAAGDSLSLAIRKNGQVVAWGGNGLDDLNRLVRITPSASLEYMHPTAVGPTEGATFHSLAGMLMKRYHELPAALLGDKLRYMIDNPPDGARDSRPLMIWPQSLVFHPFKSHLMGYTCVYIDAPSLTQWLMHTPPSTTRGVTIAYWCARALAAVHMRGYIVGSLTTDDIVVYDDGMVALRDCDRYQVGDGRMYVGQRFATPNDAPELVRPHDSPVNMWQRLVLRLKGQSQTMPSPCTEYSDAFALAVVIFMLVCEHRHPFDGVLLDGAHQEVVRMADVWPYDTTQRRCQPPPGLMDCYQRLPDALKSLFVRAFTGAPTQRPLPHEWVAVLATLR